MSILRLQTMQPLNMDYHAAVLSITSSNTECCRGKDPV